MRHFRDLLVSWGPLGLFVLSAVESAGIPNPGGTDLVILILTIARPADALLCAAAATLGSLVGTIVFFEAVYKGGEKFLARSTSSGRGQRFRAWFLRYGLVTVFIPALVPFPLLPMKVFVLCAGAMRVNRGRFYAVLLAGRIPRYLGLALLGAQLGEGSKDWLKSHVWHMIVLAVLLTVLLGGLIRWNDHNRNRRASAAGQAAAD
jgi:membrane protein DedA with SNARE-associated domain